jgi:hypothetical protein
MDKYNHGLRRMGIQRFKDYCQELTGMGGMPAKAKKEEKQLTAQQKTILELASNDVVGEHKYVRMKQLLEKLSTQHGIQLTYEQLNNRLYRLRKTGQLPPSDKTKIGAKPPLRSEDETQQLFEDNKKLAVGALKTHLNKWYGRIERDEAQQIAELAVYKAMRRWKPELASKSRFAYICVKHALIRELQRRKKQSKEISMETTRQVDEMPLIDRLPAKHYKTTSLQPEADYAPTILQMHKDGKLSETQTLAFYLRTFHDQQYSAIARAITQKTGMPISHQAIKFAYRAALPKITKRLKLTNPPKRN